MERVKSGTGSNLLQALIGDDFLWQGTLSSGYLGTCYKTSVRAMLNLSVSI